MKKAILLTLVLGVSLAHGAWAEVPEYLQDGEITVTLKNGQTYTFPSNQWKIVNRAAKSAPKPEPAAEKAPEPVPAEVATKAPASTTPPPAVAPEPKKPGHFVFSVIPQVGIGPDGLKTSAATGGWTNEVQTKAVFGATLCGGSSDIFAKLCGTAYTNHTYSLGIGLDF